MNIEDIIDKAKMRARVSDDDLYEACHIFAEKLQRRSIWDFLLNNRKPNEDAILLIQHFIFFGAKSVRDETKKEIKMWECKNDSR